MTQDINDQLVLISGESSSGKSASLMHLPKPERVMYLNCEAGKRLPFRNRFGTFVITDPYQVLEAFDHAAESGAYDTIVIDTITFLMEMFESQYVLTSANTMQAWGAYAQFFKQLMQDKVAKSQQAVIVLGHTRSDLDEKSMEMRTAVPVKGSLKNVGIESYFSTVVSTKRIAIKDLAPYRENNDLLVITEAEEALGFKHVFQTQLTKTTIGERIRAPLGLFTREQTFIDNDAGKLLACLHDYYG